MARTRKRSVRRGRGGSRKFNTKLMLDIALAKLGVDILPGLLSKVVPIDPTITTVVGVGGTWFLGNMLKKPDMSTAAIALGVLEFVQPFINDLTGGMSPQKQNLPAGIIGAIKMPQPSPVLTDGIRLNDGVYVPFPTAKSSREYGSGY